MTSELQAHKIYPVNRTVNILVVIVALLGGISLTIWGAWINGLPDSDESGYIILDLPPLFEMVRIPLGDALITVGAILFALPFGEAAMTLVRSLSFVRNELAKVIYGSEYLIRASEEEIERIWQDVSAVMMRKNFRDEDDVEAIIRIATQHHFKRIDYYEIGRRVTYKVISFEDGILTFEETDITHIYPAVGKDQKFNFTRSVKWDPHEDIEMTTLTVDDQDLKDQLLVTDEEKREMTYSLECKARNSQGNKTYRLKEVTITKVRLEGMTYDLYQAKTFVKGSTVSIDNPIPQKIKVKFVPFFGGSNKNDRQQGYKEGPSGTYQFQGMLFPRSGYMVLFEQLISKGNPMVESTKK